METPDGPLLIPKIPNKLTNPSSKEGHDSSLTQNSVTLCEKEEYKLINKGRKVREGNIKKDISAFQIEITQWNGRSINSEAKSSFIRSLPGNLITIQEIWQRMETVKELGDILDFQWREYQRGGGTATLNNGQMVLTIVNRFEINKDSNALKLRVQNSYIWLINLYLNKGTCSKLQKLFGKIRRNIPQNEWNNIIIIGDFNIDLNKQSSDKALLQALVKQLGLTIETPTMNTRRDAKLDYLIRGAGIKVSDNQVITSVSDHKAVWWKLEISGIKRKGTIKIPNRKCADEIITILLKNKRVKNAKQFLQGLAAQRKLNRRRLYKIIRKRKLQVSSLFELLLKAQDSEQATAIVNEHWRKFWRDTEDSRYSSASVNAYRNLRQILKYHLFEKRDGAIINCIIKEDKEITSDSREIEANLLKTMQEIQVDHNWPWIQEKSFPELEKLDEYEMEDILFHMGINKAIAFDGCSDLIFSHKRNGKNVSLQSLTIKKLNDLWKTRLDELAEMENTWDTRLVPLNKVFPQIPTRTQLRPIVVQSPLVKLLESRFLSKLQEYCTFKLDRSQTGFVPGLGTQVNITRALDRITLRTKRNQPVYGLFIDFSNAYNTVPHSRLFEKLRAKAVLEAKEIDFIEQLYARYRIKLGGSRLRCNKGVAQGSVISPSLFDIYIEDLSSEILKNSVHSEDILYYADDVLILCTTPNQVKQCIKSIEGWCHTNGMSLNKAKSGVVIFGARRAKNIPKMQIVKENKIEKTKNSKIAWTPTEASIEGVPICPKYKYLGTWLDSKLSCGPQIAHIKKKSAHLFTKLYPYLTNASADARRDMWQTMVAPLFNAALVLLEFEQSSTHRNHLERVRRISFKQFMLISKRTNTWLVDEMIRKDINYIATQTVRVSRAQWEQRKQRTHITEKLPFMSEANGLRGVPNSFCQLINSQVKPCQLCCEKGTISSAWHMKYAHGIPVIHINKIWEEEILPITENSSFHRNKITKLLEPAIQKHLDYYQEAIKFSSSNGKKFKTPIEEFHVNINTISFKI